jgi:hypothetical protein
LNTCCLIPCGKHTSACISKAIMAAWNRSSHCGTCSIYVPLTSARTIGQILFIFGS